MNKNKYTVLLIIVASFIILRLLVLFTSIELVLFSEELFKGTIAKDLIEGLKMSFFDYQFSPYEGGSLLVGLLTIPFFLIFGQNLIALKLVPLSFYLVTLILLYLFCDKFFNRKIAIFSSILFILSPQLLTRFSLSCNAHHSESIFFTILTLFIFYQIFFNNKKNNFYFVMFGLICGIGLWFAYIFAITLLTCLLFWFVFDRLFFLKKQFAIFVGSFLVGFSLWLYNGYTDNWNGLVLKGVPMTQFFNLTNQFTPLIDKVFYFLTRTIRNSFLFDDFLKIKGVYLSNIYYLITVIAFACLLWFNRRSILRIILSFLPIKSSFFLRFKISKEALFLVYLLIFSIIFSATPLHCLDKDRCLAHRYLIPLHLFIFVIISLFLYKLLIFRNRYLKFLSYFIFSILVILGFIANIGLIGRSGFGHGFNWKGYSYQEFGLFFGRTNKDAHDIYKVNRIIGKLRPADRQFFCMALGGRNVFLFIDVLNRDETKKRTLNNLDKKYLSYFYSGFIYAANDLFISNIDDMAHLNINTIVTAVQTIDSNYRYFFYEGLPILFIGKNYPYQDYRLNISSVIKQLNSLEVDAKARPYLYRGLGYVSDFYAERSIYYANSIDQLEEALVKMNQNERSSFFYGMGEAIGGSDYFTLFDKYMSLSDIIGGEYKQYFYEGIGRGIAYRFGEDLNKCDFIINKININYRYFIKKGFDEFMKDLEAG